MMNLSEIKFALSNLNMECAKKLGVPAPKIVYGEYDKKVTTEYGVNELYIDEKSLYNFDDISDLIDEFFCEIYFNYIQCVTKDFYYLENNKTVMLWKNELIKKIMTDERLNLDIDKSCEAFCYYMSESFFGVKRKVSDSIKEKYEKFKKRYN